VCRIRVRWLGKPTLISDSDRVREEINDKHLCRIGGRSSGGRSAHRRGGLSVHFHGRVRRSRCLPAGDQCFSTQLWPQVAQVGGYLPLPSRSSYQTSFALLTRKLPFSPLGDKFTCPSFDSGALATQKTCWSSSQGMRRSGMDSKNSGMTRQFVGLVGSP
jgi:hypothetical protein